MAENCPEVMQKDLRGRIFSIFGGSDRFLWRFNQSGDYTVKSGYKILSSELPNGNMMGPELWKVLWKMNIPAKVALFIWKLLNDGISVRHELIRRNMQVDPNCPLCGESEETIVHLFLTCEMVRTIWFGSFLSIRISKRKQLTCKQWIVEWLTKIINMSVPDQLVYGIFLLIWCIWLHRNDVVFQ